MANNMKQVTKEFFYSTLMSEEKDVITEFSGNFIAAHKSTFKYRYSRTVFGEIQTKIEKGIYPHVETYFLQAV